MLLSGGLSRTLGPTVVGHWQIANEALYRSRRGRFLDRRTTAIASRRLGVGNYDERFLDPVVGKRYRVRGCGNACIHAFA